MGDIGVSQCVAGHLCSVVLTHTDGTGALEKQSEKELGRYHNLGTQKAIVEALGGEWVLGDLESPNVRLATLPDLLERFPKPHAVKLPKKSADLAGRSDEARALFRLHDARNSFAHFGELNWFIAKPYFHDITRSAIQKMITLIREVEPNRYREWDRDEILGLLQVEKKELDNLREGLPPFSGSEE